MMTIAIAAVALMAGFNLGSMAGAFASRAWGPAPDTCAPWFGVAGLIGLGGLVWMVWFSA